MATGSALLNADALLARTGLASGMRVADLGCGATGHLIIPAALLVGEHGKAYAVDIQRSALAATESKAKLDSVSVITYIWSDLERDAATPIPAGSLDVALLVSTLHLTNDRAAVLREAARLVRGGGRVLVVEWKPIASVMGPPAERRVPEDALIATAQEVGLTFRERFDAGPQHYGVLFVKGDAGVTSHGTTL
ncbi:MAG: methyltransferase domain-containing protein [bacterium]|nr:methyltransferase domain-containing protein [bacterium]